MMMMMMTILMKMMITIVMITNIEKELSILLREYYLLLHVTIIVRIRKRVSFMLIHVTKCDIIHPLLLLVTCGNLVTVKLTFVMVNI